MTMTTSLHATNSTSRRPFQRANPAPKTSRQITSRIQPARKRLARNRFRPENVNISTMISSALRGSRPRNTASAGSNSHRVPQALLHAALAILLFSVTCALTGCNGFFIDDNTTTTLTSSATTSIDGASIVLTVKVVPVAATGTITFYDGTTSLGTATLSSGVASFTTSSLAVGTHSITAQYGGDTTYNQGTSNAVTVVIDAALTTTTTALTTSATTAAALTPVTLTATLSSTVATGSVTFYTGTITLGTGTVAVGVATFSTTALPVGTDSVTAIYGGDSAYATSTSGAVTITITAANTSLGSATPTS